MDLEIEWVLRGFPEKQDNIQQMADGISVDREIGGHRNRIWALVFTRQEKKEILTPILSTIFTHI